MKDKFLKAIAAIDSIKNALEIDDNDLETLIKFGFAYTHIIGAAIVDAKIADQDLLKIAKCIIGNINYRNHVPAEANNSIIDNIDRVAAEYIGKNNPADKY